MTCPCPAAGAGPGRCTLSACAGPGRPAPPTAEGRARAEGGSRIAFPAGYRLDAGVWVPEGDARDLPFSDGDDEERHLAELLAGARDLSLLSPELRRLTGDRHALYHLSPRRGNLLRPLAGALTGRVLEVGAGCGAITRYLGELGCRVTAVEGSRRRAGIARLRTRDQPNVEVVWEDANRLTAGEPFDAILMVGVLEYARVFVGAGADSQRRLLAHLRGLLREDGMLVVAIENQLGARYWAGGLEDHVGWEYYGIHDSYTDASVATFGRRQLGEILTAAGLPHQEWYVPVPDYKLPVAVLSPLGLRLAGRWDAATVLAQAAAGDIRRPERPRFSLERVWSVLQRNGLLLDFANSFLVAAGPSAAFRRRLAQQGQLAWLYAADRDPAWAVESSVCAEGDRWMVRRRQLAPGAPPPGDGPLQWRLRDEPYLHGDNWWSQLVALVCRPGWDAPDVAAWARRWWREVLGAAGLDPGSAAAERKVDGWLLEATPPHLVVGPEGTGCFCDLEWGLRGGVELGILAYRGLARSLGRLTRVTWSRPGPPPTPAGLLARTLAELGLPLQERELERYRRLDAALEAAKRGQAPPAAAGR